MRQQGLATGIKNSLFVEMPLFSRFFGVTTTGSWFEFGFAKSMLKCSSCCKTPMVRRVVLWNTSFYGWPNSFQSREQTTWKPRWRFSIAAWPAKSPGSDNGAYTCCAARSIILSETEVVTDWRSAFAIAGEMPRGLESR